MDVLNKDGILGFCELEGIIAVVAEEKLIPVEAWLQAWPERTDFIFGQGTIIAYALETAHEATVPFVVVGGDPYVASEMTTAAPDVQHIEAGR